MYGNNRGRSHTGDSLHGGAITLANIRHKNQKYRSTSQDSFLAPPEVKQWKEKTFQGYLRADGQVGTSQLLVGIATCFL